MILKKIAGLGLLIFAVILTLATVVNFFKSLGLSAIEIKNSSSGGVGYLIGSMVVHVLCVLLIIYLRKKGLQLMRSKNEVDETLNEIGKQ